MLDLVTSTLFMLEWRRGVTRLLSPDVNKDFRNAKSVNVVDPEGTPPSQIPVTVDTPDTKIVSPSIETPVIILNVGTFNPEVE